MKFKTKLKLIALFLSLNSILSYKAFAMEDAPSDSIKGETSKDGSGNESKDYLYEKDKKKHRVQTLIFI